MYIYCIVCYRVIAVPCVRSTGCVSVFLYTSVDESESESDQVISRTSLKLTR